MDCETWRGRLAAEPAANRAAFSSHAEHCASCRAYGRRLLKAEALIERALRLDPLPLRRPTPSEVTRFASRWVHLGAGLAAAAVAALTLWSFAGGSRQPVPEALAAAVIEHWAHEPDALLRTETQVAERTLLEVLFGTAALDRSAAGLVSYARICRVGGQFVPHLVLQGERSPFMVLLMVGEALDATVPLADSDGTLAGRIVPSGGGNIAVLGNAGAELDAMTSLVASAVDWNDGL